jgi:hypothetical protein
VRISSDRRDYRLKIALAVEAQIRRNDVDSRNKNSHQWKGTLD